MFELAVHKSSEVNSTQLFLLFQKVRDVREGLKGLKLVSDYLLPLDHSSRQSLHAQVGERDVALLHAYQPEIFCGVNDG